MSNSAYGLCDRVRNSDRAASLAGRHGKETRREPISRPPAERHDDPGFHIIAGADDRLERDPEFPPSKIRLEAHALTPAALVVQIESFRRTGFGPVAISRLVGLCPKDINTIAPPTHERKQPASPPPPPIPRRSVNAGRYSAAAAKGPARKQGRPAKKKA